MTTLLDVEEIGRQDHFLAVVSTLRADATIQSSVVNAGILPHPVDGEEVVGFVTAGLSKPVPQSATSVPFGSHMAYGRRGAWNGTSAGNSSAGEHHVL